MYNIDNQNTTDPVHCRQCIDIDTSSVQDVVHGVSAVPTRSLKIAIYQIPDAYVTKNISPLHAQHNDTLH